MTPGRELPSIPYAGDASPCEAHACRHCCFETEMPLLRTDTERLEAHTGQDRDTFSRIDNETGERVLRNTDTLDEGRPHCVFLGPQGCTVYEDRPTGCRLYPLVHEAERGIGVLDPDCPHHREFRIRPKDRANLADVIEELMGEIETRHRTHQPSDND